MNKCAQSYVGCKRKDLSILLLKIGSIFSILIDLNSSDNEVIETVFKSETFNDMKEFSKSLLESLTSADEGGEIFDTLNDVTSFLEYKTTRGIR